jgi:hypothetical protein
MTLLVSLDMLFEKEWSALTNSNGAVLMNESSVPLWWSAP